VGARETDDLGALCPYAAHTRRANPRDDNYVQGNNNPTFPDAEQHRIRRFATPYGPPYTPESAGAQRGLVGWFMCASLVQQFEFVMNTWITAPGGGFRTVDASPNTSGVDPLFGPQPPSIDPVDGDFDFDYLAGASYDTVPGLTRFIRTDGGLYAFIPSLTAIRQLSTPSPAPPKKRVPAVRASRKAV